MDFIEGFYTWLLDTGLISLSRSKNVKLTVKEWLPMAPAYSLFMGATLWLIPVFFESLVYLFSIGNAAAQATLFFMRFTHYFALYFLPMLILGFLLSLPQIWAWNRRVNRLNHEASLWQAAVAPSPTTWPPPPTASVSDNVELK